MIAVDDSGVPEYRMLGQPLTTDHAEVQNPSSCVEYVVDEREFGCSLEGALPFNPTIPRVMQITAVCDAVR